MKLVKLKYSDVYLVASAVATLEVMEKMGDEGLPRTEVESYLEVRVKELINTYNNDKNLYQTKIQEIQSNSGWLDLIKKIQSTPLDLYAGDVVGFIHKNVLALNVVDTDPSTGKLNNISWGDFLLIPTEEYALAVYKTTLELQNSTIQYSDDGYHQKFGNLVNLYVENYINDNKLFLNELSKIVPQEKSSEVAKFTSDLLAVAIEQAAKANTTKTFVLNGLENKLLRFQKLEKQ